MNTIAGITKKQVQEPVHAPVCQGNVQHNNQFYQNGFVQQKPMLYGGMQPYPIMNYPQMNMPHMKIPQMRIPQMPFYNYGYRQMPPTYTTNNTHMHQHTEVHEEEVNEDDSNRSSNEVLTNAIETLSSYFTSTKKTNESK